MNGRAKGYIGEQLAAEYLSKAGWKIVGRNVRSCGVEVDIIAFDGDTLVFCEVKTADRDDATPAEWVSTGQRRRYVKAAQGYVAHHSLYGADVRFDVAEVCGGKVRLTKNAFDADCR